MTTRTKRHVDPQQTSLDAGLAATTPIAKLRASQARVLNMFKLYGDMTDKQLKEYLHDAERGAGITKLMSDSGIRTRRSELVKAGLLRDTGRKAHQDGANCIVWGLAT